MQGRTILVIDDNDAVAVQYGVRAIPTMILFKGGAVAETLVGMMPKAALKANMARRKAQAKARGVEDTPGTIKGKD